MNILKSMLFVIFYLIAPLVFAYTPQEGNVTANIGTYIYKTNFNDVNTRATSPWKMGVGLLVNGDISKQGALEIAMFHMNKLFLRRDQDKSISELTQVMHITMGYRRWFNEFFSSSLTFYSEYPMGDKKIVYSEFAKGNEIPTSARDTTEYGFDLSLQYQLWQGKEFDVVSDFRYALSVTSREKEESDHYGVFVALRYLMQEKDPSQKPGKKKFD